MLRFTSLPSSILKSVRFTSYRHLLYSFLALCALVGLTTAYFFSLTNANKGTATANDYSTEAVTTIVNYDFNSGTSYNTLTPALASGIQSSASSTEAFNTVTGTATDGSAFTSNGTAGQAINMTNSSGTNTRYFQFVLSGSSLSIYNAYSVYVQAQRSATGAQTLTLAYSTDGTNYTNFGTTMAPGNGSFTSQVFNLNSVTALNGKSLIYFRLLASGASGTGTLRIDNFQVRADSATAPSVAGAKTATLANDLNSNGFVNSGDTLRYSVVVGNGGTNASNVIFTDVLNGNLTLVGGTVNASPVGVNDTYSSIGNVGISVPDGASDLLGNDIDPNAGAISVLNVVGCADVATPYLCTSVGGGSLSVDANGSFTYTPTAGFEGTDSFTYTVSDGGTITDTGTVTLNVTGMIWFVNASAGAGGNGTLASPFNCFVGTNCFDDTTLDKEGDNIFLYTGAYTGGQTLLNNQRLIGQGANTALTGGGSITGITVPSFSNTLPSTGGTNPTITTTGAATNVISLGQGNTLRGLTFGNTTGADVFGNGFGTLTIGPATGASDVTINGNGQALDLTNGTIAGVGFASVTSSGGTRNISLTTISGTLALGSGALSGSSNGASNHAFFVSGGDGTITYSGSITKGNNGNVVNIGSKTGGGVTLSGTINGSSSNGINVSSNTGGTIEFSGATKTLNTAGNAAVTLATNTGATINFSGGGLDIDTTSGKGLNATNGGTIIIGTGANANTINSTTGTAVEIVGTSPGSPMPLNIQLASVSANGAASGIILTNTSSTGAPGGFRVLGNGGTCSSAATCTGGAIQNTTSNGVQITNAVNVFLTRMFIIDSADSGIFADGVDTLSMSSLFLDSNGAQSEGGAVQDSNIHLEDLIGTANTLSDSTVQDSRNTNLDWDPNSSTSQSVLTVTNTNLNHAGEGVTAQGNAGINLVATGTANVKLVVTGGQIKNNAAAGILATGSSGTTVHTDIANVDMISSPPPAPILTGACDPQPGNWGNGVGTNFGINLTSTGTSNQRHRINNVDIAYTGIAPCDGGAASAIGFIPSGTGTFDITITNNRIGLTGQVRSGNENFFGIAGDVQGSGTVRMNVSNNTVKNTALNGIYIQTRDPAPSVPGNVNADLTLRDNIVNEISDVDANDFPFGGGAGGPVETIASRLDSRNDSDLCLDVSSNTSTGLSGNEGFHVRQRDTSIFRLERATAANVVSTATVAAFIVGQNDAGTTARAQQALPFTTAANGECSDPLLPIAPPAEEMLATLEPFVKHPANSDVSYNEITKPETTVEETQDVKSGVAIQNPQPTLTNSLGALIIDIGNSLNNGKNRFVAFFALPDIVPIAHAQEEKSTDSKVPEAGETVRVDGTLTGVGGTGFSLPAGESTTITFNATIDSGFSGTAVTNQASVSGTGFGPILSNNLSTPVIQPPTISKAFNPTSIATGGTSTLTFTIGNPNPSQAFTNVSFTDNLPTNVVVATPNGLVNNCGGAPTITATAGTGAISVSALARAANSTCTIQVNVTSSVDGVYNNTTPAISSTEGGSRAAGGTVPLTVIAPPSFTKDFAATSIVIGESTTLSFTITNNSATTGLTGVAFTDNLPSGLVVSTPNGLTGSCGGGTITANQGTGIVSLSGALLSASASCTFSVNVTGTTLGLKSNSTQLSTTQLGSGATAADSITVNQASTTTVITLDSPDPSAPNQAVTVNFTVAPVSPGAGTPSGNVIITVSGGVETCNGTLSGGLGTCNITLIGSGSRTLTAQYQGSTNFSGSTSGGEPHTVENPDSIPPDTTITGNPANPTGINSATFTFTGTDNPGGSGVASFECSLDGAAYSTCTSGIIYNTLTQTTHTFLVRAIDVANNTDPTPATFTWRVTQDPADFDGDGKSDYAVVTDASAPLLSNDNESKVLSLPRNPIPLRKNNEMMRFIRLDKKPSNEPVHPRTTEGGSIQARWIIRQSGTNTTDNSIVLGTFDDFFVPSDFDGDGKWDAAVFTPGTSSPNSGVFTVRRSSDSSVVTYNLGKDTSDPFVVGDYDGDGRADPAVFDSDTGVWSYLGGATHTTPVTQSYGQGGGFFNLDYPVPGDFNGDGKHDFGVMRRGLADPGQARFLISYNDGSVNIASPDISTIFGQFSYAIVPGDYDGDSKTDIGQVNLQGTQTMWRVLQSSDSVTVTRLFGSPATDYTIQGDYDGDGKVDLGVWTASTPGVFSWIPLVGGSATTFNLGNASDYPVAYYNTH